MFRQINSHNLPKKKYIYISDNAALSFHTLKKSTMQTTFSKVFNSGKTKKENAKKYATICTHTLVGNIKYYEDCEISHMKKHNV